MKIAKTADRKKVIWIYDQKHGLPKCGEPTRIVKRVKDSSGGILSAGFYFVLGVRVLPERSCKSGF